MDTAVGRVLKRLEELGLAGQHHRLLHRRQRRRHLGRQLQLLRAALSRRQGPSVGGRFPRAVLHPGARRHQARQHLRHAGDPHRFLSHDPPIGRPAAATGSSTWMASAWCRLLQGGQIAPRPLFWHYPHYGNQGGEPSSIIRKDDWKLIHYWEDDRNELYHLRRRHRRAARPRAAGSGAHRRSFGRSCRAWLKETGARIPQPYPGLPGSLGRAAPTGRANPSKSAWKRTHAAYLSPSLAARSHLVEKPHHPGLTPTQSGNRDNDQYPGAGHLSCGPDPWHDLWLAP